MNMYSIPNVLTYNTCALGNLMKKDIYEEKKIANTYAFLSNITHIIRAGNLLERSATIYVADFHRKIIIFSSFFF